jgi:hypothetical protein
MTYMVQLEGEYWRFIRGNSCNKYTTERYSSLIFSFPIYKYMRIAKESQ